MPTIYKKIMKQKNIIEYINVVWCVPGGGGQFFLVSSICFKHTHDYDPDSDLFDNV